MRSAVIGTVASLTAAVGVVGIGAAMARTTAAAGTSGGVKIAYYDQWSIYQSGFYPKHLDTMGMAGKLDILNYDFENIDPVNLTCFEATKAADSSEAGEQNPNAGDGAEDAFADMEKSYAAGDSVDGVGDVWGQKVAGNFNQLMKLKKKYPNLKILVSIGGWTYSKYFSDAAQPANRARFVSSCIDMFIRGNLPVVDGYGGPGSIAGLFDGVDIDWEYPGGGGHLGNHSSPSDKQNFTGLLAEFRSQLDALGGKHYLLTAALPSGQDKIKNVETDRIGQYLDYGNVMTYDMHGGFWEPTVTNHQSPLYSPANDPMAPVPPGNRKYNVDTAITAYNQGLSGYGIPGGFPAGKTTVGFEFYYRGWTGVQAGNSHGEYQSATGPSAPYPLSGNVHGVAMYKEIQATIDNPGYTFWDPDAQAAYYYDGTNFWSGESARSIQAKSDYLHCKGLAGGMMFSLYDFAPGSTPTLFNDAVNDINGGSAACPTPPPPGTASPTPPPTTAPPTSPPPTTPPPGGGTTDTWQPNHLYHVGDVVAYNGRTYKCLQAHTSLPGWEPPNVPALWQPTT
ncbi:glycoside hydrolase [Planosporangium thailandense]|uniref:chitinase n=2 Tax=Planosporangium thailandense TaxID=765197 RepID=A0ABX0Y3P4_9ACTN|nr:glycosyl hydrolase family 18 protein [Planosporangium thailandense]NJC72053.1 glycoside hydrolase [Planosporangium thailandense]